MSCRVELGFEMEYAPPKYVMIVSGIQNWIRSGTYRPGDLLPSEAQLVEEFNIGRTTIVRALQILQRDGWIAREHGRGSYVLGVPSEGGGGEQKFGAALADRAEADKGTKLLFVSRIAAPPQVAERLGVGVGAQVVLRRWVVEREGAPSDLGSMWLPLAVAAGTDFEREAPLSMGLRTGLWMLKNTRLTTIEERISARLPTEGEAELLRLAPSSPVLVLSVAYRADANAAPSALLELVLPGELHELESSYTIPVS